MDALGRIGFADRSDMAACEQPVECSHRVDELARRIGPQTPGLRLGGEVFPIEFEKRCDSRSHPKKRGIREDVLGVTATNIRVDTGKPYLLDGLWNSWRRFNFPDCRLKRFTLLVYC